MPALAIRPVISARRATEMLWAFVFLSDHSRRDKMKSASRRSVEVWFAENGRPMKQLIQELRQWPAPIPFVENIAEGAWHVVAEGDGGVSAQLIVEGIGSTGKAEAGGSLDIDYQSKFRAACKALDAAIDRCSLEEFHTAVTKGIAAIQSYLNWRTAIWNGKEGSPKLEDTKVNKVSFDVKIRDWVPLMAGGKSLKLDGQMWNDFRLLEKIRDDEAIHAKNLAQASSPDVLLDPINRFRTGIAQVLLELHELFDEPVPRSVIRAVYRPDVYVKR